jgi:Fur family ferric uptake transcriptional regulator
MDKPYILLADILKRHGYSITKPRQTVFTLLINQEPQSMYTLTSRAKGKIDRASVYRTIRIFEEAGIVQRIYIGWKYKVELTDIFSRHHHHLSCLRCHKLLALPEDNTIEKRITVLTNKHHWVVTNHQLEVQGYCEHCQKIESFNL